MNSTQRTRIKICGLTREADVDAAADAGADAIGLVLYANSPRCVSVERAAALAARLPPFVTPVGLFVNAQRSEIAAACAAVPTRCCSSTATRRPRSAARQAGRSCARRAWAPVSIC